MECIVYIIEQKAYFSQIVHKSVYIPGSEHFPCAKIIKLAYQEVD